MAAAPCYTIAARTVLDQIRSFVGDPPLHRRWRRRPRRHYPVGHSVTCARSAMKSPRARPAAAAATEQLSRSRPLQRGQAGAAGAQWPPKERGQGRGAGCRSQIKQMYLLFLSSRGRIRIDDQNNKLIGVRVNALHDDDVPLREQKRQELEKEHEQKKKTAARRRE